MTGINLYSCDFNDQLRSFLVDAKKVTYAAGSGAARKSLEDGSIQLQHEIGDLLYRDRYYGFNPFLGEEVVFRKGTAIWGLNYIGNCLDSAVLSKRVYEFLQTALCAVDLALPYRGPEIFARDQWKYLNEVEGSLDLFKGGERICFESMLVYICHYHGGVIKKNR